MWSEVPLLPLPSHQHQHLTRPRPHQIHQPHQIRHHLTEVLSSNNSKEDLALETAIPHNHAYPALTPPELMHVPSSMAGSQFRAVGRIVPLLWPAEDLHRGEDDL